MLALKKDRSLIAIIIIVSRNRMSSNNINSL